MVSCTNPDAIELLRSDLQDILIEDEGFFAVAFKDLETDEELLIHEKESFHAASTMKTPVMIEVYKQAKAGKFKLTDSLIITNEFKSIVDKSPYSLTAEDDSEKDLYNRIGKKKSIEELVYDMIIVSSNLATNIIIELVNAKNVTQTMREIGAKNMQVLRGVEDIKAFRQGLSNSTTAYDLMIIFEKLAKLEIVDKPSSEAMIKTLLDQRFKEIIPAYLPENVKVAHKTGVITALHHDSGIVFLPDGRKYVLVLLSKNLTDFDRGTKLMAKASKKIYDYMNSK